MGHQAAGTSCMIPMRNLEAPVQYQHEPPSQPSQPDMDSSQESLLDGHQAIALGRTATARAIRVIELASLAVSIMALISAVVIIQNDTIAWYLRYQYQIVVIGFLLSIMNIAMMTVLPTLFLRCEALFGESMIQNYEAIIRNQPLASKTGWQWRIMIALFIALPLGLSAIYKLFKGGLAVISIDSDNDGYNGDFGLYAPPGLLPLGWNTGTILMYNVTMPFLIASSNQSEPTNISTSRTTYARDEVALPSTWPQPYGFNTLLLNDSTVAMLDAPPPGWITHVQKTLRDGDHWDFSAPVLATVASRNSSVDSHRKEDSDSPFWAQFDLQEEDDMIQYQTLFNEWAIGLHTSTLNPNRTREQCFVSIQHGESLNNFTSSAQLWDMSRQYCSGTWRITRGDTKLRNGTCDSTYRPSFITQYDRPEIILTKIGKDLALKAYFLPTLNEFLGPFQKNGPNGNGSEWLWPTMATSVASMYWSRLAAIMGPGSPHWNGNNSFATSVLGNANITDGLLYSRLADIKSTRPALRKSPLLYLVLAIQPLITVIAVIANSFLWQAPISSGFNTVAISAGLDQETRGLIKGAGFSGELRQPVCLEITTEEQSEDSSKIVYRLGAGRRRGPTKLLSTRLYS